MVTMYLCPDGYGHRKAPLVEFVAEKRRFSRIMVALNVQYYADLPENGELFQGHGTLKDFSLSGLFFISEMPLPLLPGQTLTLTIAASLPQLDLFDTSHILAKGEIVRLEHPSPDHHHHGIAIKFLESPTFFNPAKLDAFAF